MTKSIKLSEADWHTLYKQLKKDYPKSVILIREKMRNVLGFVPREHEEWVEISKNGDFQYPGYNVKTPITTVHLDFYNDSKKTMFIMKYSEYLDGKL